MHIKYPCMSYQISLYVISQIVPAELWAGTFFETVVSCVFEPQSLGFNIADLEVLEKLPEQVQLYFH